MGNDNTGRLPECIRQHRNENTDCDCFGLDRYSWNQGQNAKYDFQVFENQEPALVARGGQRLHMLSGESRSLMFDRPKMDSTATSDARETNRLPAYTLKIRGECSVDSNGRSAGKGPLIQTNLSATLGVAQDQYLFVPKAESYCIGNGQVMQTGLHDKVLTLNCMHDQQIILQRKKS